MANILQINSRKGLVQLSHDELAELNLLKWIRTSFRGIGRSGFIEETPFEKVAAELYVQKYPDTQVDMAVKCVLEPDDSVTVMLRTYTTNDRMYNTAENDIVITKHEKKQAKFIHRERKKKFNSLKNSVEKIALYTGDFGGGQVQVLTPTESEDGKPSYIVGTGATKNIVSINQTQDGKPLINGWPDVKGVDIYPGDVVLLISDFSGFVGNSNLRSPEMPSYDKLINEPESNFYSKFPASRSYLSDFDKTMILLDLTARRKGDIDYTRIYIDDDTWNSKYRDKINEKLYGQFNFNSYKDFVDFLNEVNFSSTSNVIGTSNPDDAVSQIANNYDKKQLFSQLLNDIDLKDTYINYVPSVMQMLANPKNSDKIKTVTMNKVSTPAYLKEALNNVFTPKDNTPADSTVESAPMEELLAAIQEKFVDSNLKENYETVNMQLADVRLKQELKYVLKYLYNEDLKIKENVSQAPGEAIDFNSLLNPEVIKDIPIQEDYTGYIINNYPELSPNIESVINYNKVLNYLVSKNTISSVGELDDIREGYLKTLQEKEDVSNILNTFNIVDKNSINTQEGLSTLQGVIDFLVNFDKIHTKEFKVYSNEFSTDINKSNIDTITFEETPFKFIDHYIKNFSNVYEENNERKYINFNSLPKTQKEDALESIGYGKEPLTIEEFMTKCPEARDYENLWLTNWTNAPAEEKSRRLREAFALDVEVNPDFTNTLLGGEQTGLRGQNKGKEKALLDFHKYKMENEGMEAPLNLVTRDKENPEMYQKAKQEFNAWLKEYNKSLRADVKQLHDQKEQAQQELNNLNKEDANYEEQANYRKKMIAYYDDKIKESEEASIVSWEDYLNFSSTGEKESTTEGRQGNEKRQLAKVLGFTTYDDLTLPDNLDRVTAYVEDYIIDSYNLDPKNPKDAPTLSSLLSAEIGHLTLSSIKKYISEELASGNVDPLISGNVEGIPLSYEVFRKTIHNIYNKLGITDINSINEPEDLIPIAEEGVNKKLISKQERNYIEELVQSIRSYISVVTNEYTSTLQDVNNQLASYDANNISEQDAPIVEQLLATQQQLTDELSNTKELTTYLLSNIPEEVISQYGLRQSGGQLLGKTSKPPLEEVYNKKDLEKNLGLTTKTSALENPISKLDSPYSNYLLSPEVLEFIDKKIQNKELNLGFQKDYDALVSSIAPEIQKEFINQYVEQNPEIFGKGFMDFMEEQDFDASANNQDIWAIVSLLNTSFNAEGPNKETKAGLYLVTPEQLLKIDADKIDEFYNNEVKAVNKNNPNFDKTSFTPYFSSDAEKQKYNNNSYNKAIKEYKETESSMKNKGLPEDGTAIDKYKKGPIDNYKSQLTQYRSELENLPSIKKDKDRIEEIDQVLSNTSLDSDTIKKLQNEKQVITNYIEPIEKKKKLYEKKIQEAQKNISDFKPTYSVEEQVKDKTDKLNKDVAELKKISDKYELLKKDPTTSEQELNRYKDIIEKRNQMISTQQKAIEDLKEGKSIKQEIPPTINKNIGEDNQNLEQEKIERRKQLQPKKYQSIIKPITKNAAIASARKIFWLNNTLDVIEAELLNNYIKIASPIDEHGKENEVLETLGLAVDNIDLDNLEHDPDNVILELCEELVDRLSDKSNLYETYDNKGNINTYRGRGNNVDVQIKEPNTTDSFIKMLNDNLNIIASYTGDGNFINTNQQATNDMLDNDLEDEHPTSNDTSSITDKRVSSVNILNKYADDDDTDGDGDGQ